MNFLKLKLVILFLSSLSISAIAFGADGGTSGGGVPWCQGAIVTCSTDPTPNIYGTSLCILSSGAAVVVANDLAGYEHTERFQHIQVATPTEKGATWAYQDKGFLLEINTNPPSWMKYLPARLTVPGLNLKSISIECVAN
jgi:hypothetical protein